MINRLRILTLLFLVSIGILSNNSDLKCDLDLTKNKEFILTFLPNYHNNWRSNDDKFRRGDSIFIFIYASLPTTGTIEFKDVYGNDYIENFNIPDPKKVFVFKKPAYDYALRGYNLSGIFSGNSHSESIVDFSFRVKSEFPIQVYGHSQAITTSESFNVLPIESLGSNYIVLAYNANVSGYDEFSGKTPSQFVIVALEDDTEVNIKPSTATRFNGYAEQNITLNSGQVYLVQSDISSDDDDLSSSIIKSTKPIAVFSGQQRSRVPIDASGSNISRDYMAEQMPPVESWSNDAIVVPFPPPSSMESPSREFDVLRVIAGYDNTELYVDGVLLANLNKGQIYESVLTNPMHIKANSPIMAAGYKRSSGLTDNSGIKNFRGDPLLQIIPTPNQYGESYRFITIQAYEYSGFGYTPVYDEHNIAVIAEPANIPSLMLDGKPLNPTIFRPVEGSNYRYAHIRVSEGTHEMTGEKAFGLFVCGYGYANSYGYFCGVVVKRDDYEPPELQSSIDCFDVEGVVTDQKLQSLLAPQSFISNVDVLLEQFKPYVKEAKFSAKLINKYSDGKFRITGIDSVGQQGSKDIDIPGFTVTVISQLKNDDNSNINSMVDSVSVGEQKCYDFTLINYGKFNQKVDLADFTSNHPELTIDLPNTFDMAPGAKLDFKICFESGKNLNIVDTLFLSNDCISRNILALDLLASKDENAPQVSSYRDLCNQFYDLVISDSLRTDKGIDTIIVEIAENVNVSITEVNRKHFKVKVSSKDVSQDAYIKLIVRDMAGLETIFEKSLPGYTVNFTLIKQLADSTMIFDFGKKMVGIRYCDSIKLSNYGINEIVFENIRLSENIWFSLPPSQLPLIMEPGSEKIVKLCYWANSTLVDMSSDTLNFEYNCINKQIIVLGKPDSLIFRNDSRCDIPLLFEVDKVPPGAFVSDVYPNPSGGIVNLDFGNSDICNILIRIYNQLGMEVKVLRFDALTAGKYSIPLDISMLSNGYYNIRTEIGQVVFTSNFVLVK